MFRWTGPGQLTAKEAASKPTTARGRLYARGKAILLGRPLASEEEIGERLSKKKALAIFSSDAISSSAYATEEILRVLILGGVVALAYGLQVSILISGLLVVVAISYRQICIAYPTGGGSYSVSKANFGRLASLVAGHIVTQAADGRIEHFPQVGFVVVGTTLLAVGLVWRIQRQIQAQAQAQAQTQTQARAAA